MHALEHINKDVFNDLIEIIAIQTIVLQVTGIYRYQ